MIKKISYTVLIILACFVVYTLFSIDFYSNVDETRKADAAIVLGASVWGDKPSPVFEERIRHAIWLYNNNYVSKLIFTGGKGKDKKYTESFIAKKYAIESGVMEKDIFIEEKSTITQENLEFVIDIVKDNNISSVLVVSDPLHMKRAMLMAKDYKLNAYSSPTGTTKFQSVKSKADFMLREAVFLIGYKAQRIFT